MFHLLCELFLLLTCVKAQDVACSSPFLIWCQEPRWAFSTVLASCSLRYCGLSLLSSTCEAGSWKLALEVTRFSAKVSAVDSPCSYGVASQYRSHVYEFHQSCEQPAIFVRFKFVTYFSFFRFQKSYSIAQKFEIVLRSLPCHFCCNQFFMESSIIILFVWSKVDFIESLLVGFGNSVFLCGWLGRRH